MQDKLPPRFELDAFHRDVPDADLITDLIRVSRELGKAGVTFREYNANGRFSSGTIAIRFGTWNGALEKAGLKKLSERNISEDALFQNLVDVWTKLGRQPKSRDLSAELSEYSWDTYATRFGGWRKALHKFVSWANSQNIPVEPRDQTDLKSRKTPRNVNWRLRAQLLMRDGAKCSLCGATPKDGAKLQVDHILPWSKGGETTISNLQILCETCNVGKSNIVV